MAAPQPPPPIVVSSYDQAAFPGSNMPTAGLPGDTDEAGNVLTANTSALTALPVLPMVRALPVLRNPGALCFRNAVLHALFTFDRFVQLLEAVTTLLQEADRPLAGQLRDLALRFRQGDTTFKAIGAANALWHTLTQTPGNPASPVQSPADMAAFEGVASQQDAEEFLQYLLYRITATEIPVDSFDFTNPVYRRIVGFQLATRTAYDCPCQEKHRDPVLPDGVNVPQWTKATYALNVVHNPTEGSSTLTQAITRAMYVPAGGTAEKERCPKCGEGPLLGIYSKFFYLPEILSIAVTHQTTKVGKNGVQQTLLNFTNKIDCQERLDLSQLCERPADKANAVYRLKAVVIWRGGKAGKGSTGGHYYTFLRRQADTGVYWQRLDEQKGLTSVELNDGPGSLRKDTGQPRILMYEREQPQFGAPSPDATAQTANTGITPIANAQTASTGIPPNANMATSNTGAKDPPDDATYELYVTNYRVQWKPSGNTHKKATASTAKKGCCCSGSQNNAGPTGGDDADDTGGDSPVSLRGGASSDAGSDDDGPYAGFEDWDDIDQFKTAFKKEGLFVLDDNRPIDDWRDILREHLDPTEPVQYDLYRIDGLRNLITARNLGIKSKSKKVLLAGLLADDAARAASAAANQPPVIQPPINPAPVVQPPVVQPPVVQPPVVQPPVVQPPVVQPPVTQPPVNPPPVIPPPVNHPPVNQPPDVANPVLEARLRQLEDLITHLESTENPCNCPLNGQHHPGTQAAQTNKAQPCRNRALHIRLTPTGGPKPLGTRDYWLPLAPHHDVPNLNLRVSVQVSPRTPRGLYPVRISFSGPQPPEGAPEPLPRDAPLSNTIRFRLPFYVYPQNILYEMWQEDMPHEPMLANRGSDVTFQPSSGVGRTRTAAEAGFDQGGDPTRKRRSI